MGKLSKSILMGAGALLLAGGVIWGSHTAEKKSIETITNGVMDFCGDKNHVDKVVDYYHRQMGWNREPQSPDQLVERHKNICPGYGKDY